MKKEWKDKWVAALRSGEYKQTKGQLFNGEGYCCLGVLCKVVGKEFRKDEKDKEFSVYYCDYDKSVLPVDVMELVSIRYSNPEVIYKGKDSSLAYLNDHGSTFEEIADLIEDQL